MIWHVTSYFTNIQNNLSISQFQLHECEDLRYNTTSDDTIQHNTIRYDTTWHDTIWHNMIRYDTIRYDATRHDMTWHTKWYSTIWTGTEQYMWFDAIQARHNKKQYNTTWYKIIQHNTIWHDHMIQYYVIQYIWHSKVQNESIRCDTIQ